MNMKKFTLLLMLFLGWETYLFSQSLVYVQDGKVLNNGSTVIVKEVLEAEIYPHMKAHISVKNQTLTDVPNATMTVSLVEESTSNGSIGYCGWGTQNCSNINYGSPISRTTTIQAGAEVDPNIEVMGVDPENISFKLEYKLTYGENTQIIYVVFTSEATAVSSFPKSTPIVVFNNESGTSVDYSFDSADNRQLFIYSIIGKKLAEINLSNNSGHIQLPNLSKGIYLYSVVENKQIIQAGKFIAK